MEQEQKSVDYHLRPAEPTELDAQGIAGAYNSVYEDYPFVAFTDPEMVQEEVIPGGDSDNFVVEVDGGQVVDGREIPEDTVVGTGSVKYHRDGHEAEFGGIVLDPEFQEMDGAPFYQDLVDQRVETARESGADRYVTHPVSSVHAKTQHGHAKKGAVPEGVSINKYPEVFQGEGRETVVPMVYPDGNFQYTDGDSREVYVTDETAGLVDNVLSGVNSERDETLARDLEVGPEDVDVDGYSVTEKVYDDEVGRMASFQVVPGGSKSMDEAMNAIDEAVDDDDVRWVGVEFDANDESAWEVSQALSERDFTPERYSPEAINYGDDVSDAMGYQFHKDGTGEIQLIDSAKEALEATGTEFDDRGQGPVPGVQNVSVS
ncbi:hypothetical protein [Candidatus Nanohalovita haloferacivicina]|uniref:hypothetical protein n=1 Tax=Candidatus Nanohalovita haloferacivicina TaxID=2978046 RepID=UPI00325FBCCB|nr:hypothetical protein HBNXNv_0659 [Candidatus Nanohalobia archaeon BNXNv]